MKEKTHPLSATLKEKTSMGLAPFLQRVGLLCMRMSGVET